MGHRASGIGINITRNQETARAVSLQDYFGVGKRHCRFLLCSFGLSV